MEKLLQTLTTKEKIGQLMQLAPYLFIRDLKIEVAGHVRDLNLDEEKIFSSGSILGVGSAKEMIEVQKKYLEKSRHKIPLIFMADIIHGYKTIFPVPLALAASFNPELVQKAARISAIEAQTSGIHVTFSPMSDLSRDPRWGRVVESFGEDPYLIGVMSAAMVKGYQNDGIDKVGNIASCVKHFAGYGASEAGRDYNTVDVSHLSLHSTYLPGYKKALDAGARLVMTAFNVIDGIPCTVNSYLLRNVLHDLWGHKKVVSISDYDSLNQIRAHGVASSMKEVAYKGITGGLDIEMASTSYVNHLETLINEKKVDINLLDEAVLRILELKRDLGLFENPYKGADESLEQTLVFSKEHLDEALKVAHESVVLLKNNQILPLKKTAKIALIGPYAQSRKTIGPWSWHGRRDLHMTLEEAFGNQISFCKTAESATELTDDDLLSIKDCDVCLLALGEDEHLSGEAHSRSNITLPGQQVSLFNAIKSLNIPTIVILTNGRPLLLQDIHSSDAILECFFLGSRHAEAIRDIVLGDVNPSGKLPISFPKVLGQIPIYYNHLNTGRPYLGPGDHNEYVSKYLDVDNEPMYPFGYGLSYSSFAISDFILSDKKMTPEGSINAKITITNNSDIPGYETLQLYIRDHFAKVSRPVKELKQFRKIYLNAHESKTISFNITLNDLTYLLHEGQITYDLGKFTVFIGTSSADLLKEEFELI